MPQIRRALEALLARVLSAMVRFVGAGRVFHLFDHDTRVDLAAAELKRSVDFEAWERRGLHVTPVHFYQPVPDTRELDPKIWDLPTELVGVDLNVSGQLRLLDEFARSYRNEYEALPTRPTAVPYQFSLNNQSFESVDAEVLWCMVRHFKPERVYEVGSGNTTYLTAQALLKNAEEGSTPPGTLVAIEPYPNAVLRSGFPGLTELLTTPVQGVPLARFQELKANDILFIDSSHVLKIGSDVQYEFLEVLPRLRPGVIVHIHDIFLPLEYPKVWVLDEHRFWNEQYLLQAFLSSNRSFEVLWAGAYMNHRHPERLEGAFQSYTRQAVLPGSFWMRRTS
jgi:hypothetical protein